MKLLRVIATLDPSHGGPSSGLRAITPALAALGHETTFATLDAPSAAADASSGPARVVPLGPARGGYAYAPDLGPWLRAHAGEYDAVFVHGLWQYHGRAVRRALRGTRTPYFVFPHGMLDPWFRRAYPLKHAKKWLYWQLCERAVLRDAAAVLFTCEEERLLARQSFHPYACEERVVAYGTAAPPDEPAAQRSSWERHLPAVAGRPFWLFLGRVHAKKGVDLFLRAATALGAAGHAIPPLVIAGPCPDAAYRAQLARLVAHTPIELHWAGMISGDVKWGALRQAEAFVLPSHQENFGLAVVEALAVGTPVLISRQVNIWAEITADGAGLADADDVAGTEHLLAAWLAMDEPARQRMRVAAAAAFRERYEVQRVAASLVATISPFVAHHSAAAIPA
ncbi:glycosyltransferase [Horticoccus luteus]|uniref:Glycosyltransferase n=1 Tax=Horticoccus luteus TaxID=2862869 RepID=A0A8F9TY32_9BACT|nr:glycosyltransferase [Horticoccus luteus]QYM80338.1 glycosyltransferase [Horticoccus luteus]